jgi:hypothetical protein
MWWRPNEVLRREERHGDVGLTTPQIRGLVVEHQLDDDLKIGAVQLVQARNDHVDADELRRRDAYVFARTRCAHHSSYARGWSWRRRHRTRR